MSRLIPVDSSLIPTLASAPLCACAGADDTTGEGDARRQCHNDGRSTAPDEDAHATPARQSRSTAAAQHHLGILNFALRDGIEPFKDESRTNHKSCTAVAPLLVNSTVGRTDGRNERQRRSSQRHCDGHDKHSDVVARRKRNEGCVFTTVKMRLATILTKAGKSLRWEVLSDINLLVAEARLLADCTSFETSEIRSTCHP
ncbi:hypothetical protein PybrP1_008812 [[Pythium] brassicae (nom. inval.)]|nr:hypothetical protein PybrP1_008812 [[Pythium] brassicae (nom. inval.)]